MILLTVNVFSNGKSLLLTVNSFMNGKLLLLLTINNPINSECFY